MSEGNNTHVFRNYKATLKSGGCEPGTHHKFFFAQLNISSLPHIKTRTQYAVLLINKPLSSTREPQNQKCKARQKDPPKNAGYSNCCFANNRVLDSYKVVLIVAFWS